MKPLTLEGVAAELHEQLRQALHLQSTDAGSHCRGALINPEWGLPDPTHGATGALVTGAGCLYLLSRTRGVVVDGIDELLDHAQLAGHYLLRAQRPTGRIDLPTCNYDSAPDTAFVVQDFARLLEHGRPLPVDDPRWAKLLTSVETFFARAARGLIDGGFHTPNHRWVIASALAKAQQLLPGFDAERAIELFTAEGVDIDAEGAFQERSAGVYDAVTNRSLLMLDAVRPWPAATEAVVRNLAFNAHMLHADGTIETALSRRQDAAKAIVPAGLIPVALAAARRTGDGRPAALANHLWSNRSQIDIPTLVEILWEMIADARPVDPSSLPGRFARLFPANRLWRMRDGLLSVSAFAGRPDLASVVYGQARICAVRIRQAYFGAAGDFIADSIEPRQAGVELRSSGRHHPRRPAYDLALDETVPVDRWEQMLPRRAQRQLPPAAMSLDVRLAPDGLDLHLRAQDGLEGVATCMVFDCPPGGRWDTDSAAFDPLGGQVIALKAGRATIAYGPDRIEIGPGAGAHRMLHMRDLPPALGMVRIMLTWLTPIDHVIQLRFRRGMTPRKQPQVDAGQPEAESG